MASTIKGYAACPECGSRQAVKGDGRKLFITCTECRTFTNYLSKDAKARIEQRLVPVEVNDTLVKEPRPTIPANAVDGNPVHDTIDQLEDEQSLRGFWHDFSRLFDDDQEAA